MRIGWEQIPESSATMEPAKSIESLLHWETQESSTAELETVWHKSPGGCTHYHSEWDVIVLWWGQRRDTSDEERCVWLACACKLEAVIGLHKWRWLIANLSPRVQEITAFRRIGLFVLIGCQVPHADICAFWRNVFNSQHRDREWCPKYDILFRQR